MSRSLVVFLFCTSFVFAPSALADRMPLPETKICNKTSHKVYVATAIEDSYVGWTFKGWSYLKPSECRVFKQDAFHVRGKQKLRGMDKKRMQVGCVTDEKVFSLTLGHSAIKAECKKEKKRKVVNFCYHEPGPNPQVDVVEK